MSKVLQFQGDFQIKEGHIFNINNLIDEEIEKYNNKIKEMEQNLEFLKSDRDIMIETKRVFNLLIKEIK